MFDKLNVAFRAPVLMTAALLACMAAAPAFGADIVTADIPFAFQAASRTLPAGTYDFTIHRTQETVVVTNATKPKAPSATEIFITTLASPSSQEARIVFDKVKGTYVLSEIWQPEGDGILVHATKGKHEHHVIHAKK